MKTHIMKEGVLSAAGGVVTGLLLGPAVGVALGISVLLMLIALYDIPNDHGNFPEDDDF